MPKQNRFYLDKAETLCVEFSKLHRCRFCDTEGSYWIGTETLICRQCILELAELLKDKKIKSYEC